MSPHNPGGYRTTSLRQPSKHRPSSSAAPSGTPVSPLGVPITSQFTPTPVSGPTELARTPSRAQGGTPPADLSALSNPFSWNAEGGHSAPLPPFPDAAHKAVHDEVMKVRRTLDCTRVALYCAFVACLLPGVSLNGGVACSVHRRSWRKRSSST